MATEKKHHYRAVFKSDHLGSADLEDFIEQGKLLTFTIREVKQEIGVSVAGKKGNHNIAYFIEPIKPLVLNATNSKVVKSFAGGSPFVEDWKNVPVELYIDENVKMKGETVSGVRIKSVNYDNVLAAIKNLFELKSESMTEDEKIKAERIIANKETASYAKLQIFLQAK